MKNEEFRSRSIEAEDFVESPFKCSFGAYGCMWVTFESSLVEHHHYPSCLTARWRHIPFSNYSSSNSNEMCWIGENRDGLRAKRIWGFESFCLFPFFWFPKFGGLMVWLIFEEGWCYSSIHFFYFLLEFSCVSFSIGQDILVSTWK